MKTASKLVTEGSPKQFHLLLLSFFLPTPTLFSFFSRTMCFLMVFISSFFIFVFWWLPLLGRVMNREDTKSFTSHLLWHPLRRDSWRYWKFDHFDIPKLCFFWFYSLALSFALYEKEAENWMNQTSFLWKNNFEFF